MSFTSTDGFIWNSDARYIYYPHSLSRDSGRPLARVELGEYNVQGMDYYYTLQGWLKGVNMPMEGDPGTDGENGLRTGGDAFAFSLGYHEKDYVPISENLTLSDGRDQLWERYKEQHGSGQTGLYNGNISWMSTDLSGLEANKRMQAMVYGYDQLHRIVQARSLTEYKAGTGYAKREKKYKKHAPYDVDYSYDGNGNLLTLQRRGHRKAMLDNFKYGYYHGTNRLWHTAADDGDNYQYDPIGNLIADQKEGTQISWNPYGKVRRVDKNGGNATHFRYDAAGNRVAKITDTDSTVYVRDASGNMMAVYQNGMLSEQSIYGSSRLGLHRVAAKPGYRTLGHKQYELSNHLGNVLATVRDRIQLSSDSTWAEAVSISDYYPFGLTMEGRSLQNSSYRYGFNAKEKDSNGEWGSKSHYDYGFRIYNPGIGKFLSVDPLTSSYPWYTPYQFAGNKPIKFVDLDGLEEYDPMQDPLFTTKLVKTYAYDVALAFKNVVNAVHGSNFRKVYKLDEDGNETFEIETVDISDQNPFVTFGHDVLNVVTMIPGGKSVTGSLFARSGGNQVARGLRKFLKSSEFRQLPIEGTIDPNAIRFSQNSIKSTFGDGRSIEGLTKGLKDGSIDISSIKPVRIVEKDGLIFSLDNRRLKAFQDAGVEIPFQKVEFKNLPKKELDKFSTTNNGESIRVRGTGTN